MKECDWTKDIITSFEEFVSNDRQILCLFYENDVLKATFSIPDARTDTVMWFLKTDVKERLDNTNFLKLILFGKIDTHVEKTMFLLFDSLYSPFIFSWSTSILFFLQNNYNQTVYAIRMQVDIFYHSRIWRRTYY